MSGISVGASGETADDMDPSGFKAKEALLITSIVRAGEACSDHHSSSPRNFRGDEAVLLLRGRRLALGGFFGVGVCRFRPNLRLFRLFWVFPSLDLLGFAQLCGINPPRPSCAIR